MLKYFCDKCGNEIKGCATPVPMYAYDGLGTAIKFIRNNHLCEECAKKFHKIEDQLEREEDFFTMKDEEISYCEGASDFIEWLLTNDKYAACTIDTDEECILCEVGLTKDMWTKSADELLKEFQKSI